MDWGTALLKNPSRGMIISRNWLQEVPKSAFIAMWILATTPYCQRCLASRRKPSPNHCCTTPILEGGKRPLFAVSMIPIACPPIRAIHIKNLLIPEDYVSHWLFVHERQTEQIQALNLRSFVRLFNSAWLCTWTNCFRWAPEQFYSLCAVATSFGASTQTFFPYRQPGGVGEDHVVSVLETFPVFFGLHHSWKENIVVYICFGTSQLVWDLYSWNVRVSIGDNSTLIC